MLKKIDGCKQMSPLATLFKFRLSGLKIHLSFGHMRRKHSCIVKYDDSPGVNQVPPKSSRNIILFIFPNTVYWEFKNHTNQQFVMHDKAEPFLANCGH